MAIKLQDKLTGIFSIFDYVQLREGVPLEELAAAFEMKPAELRQLLVDLTMIDIPELDYDAIPRLDFELLEEEGIVDFTDTPVFDAVLEFNQFEAYALVVGLSLLEPQLGETERQLCKALKIKLINHYKLNTSMDSVQVIASEELNIYCQALLEAISNQHSVWIEYLSLQKVHSEREIIPVEVNRVGKHLLVKAYCLKAGELRHFRVDRILRLQPGDPVEIPQMAQKRTRNPRVTVQLEQVPEDLKDAAVDLQELEDSATLTLRIYDESWLETQLLLYADLLHDVNNSGIVRTTRTKAQSLIEMYDLLSAKTHGMP
ncbi:hypothetical protein HMPREF0044_1287 [Gleimia coleocanis DSM 15436]|uniref:WYL domain-containing protein n=1 Tax=Gleimia coleocanis DSM 15436 TaxID=525245 RepID=C0W1J7_9ACTO|nr:WYL domain-containing protein [Gleimia coleocanis]EEH63363.1 hypothetical protein HMPREF0044_1287 [Gleimia coleocanis DSM 15436]